MGCVFGFEFSNTVEVEVEYIYIFKNHNISKNEVMVNIYRWKQYVACKNIVTRLVHENIPTIQDYLPPSHVS